MSLNELKCNITFEDFAKLDLRFGTVLAAERVPKSKKLIKLQVSFGDFQRQIVAGIGELNKAGLGITPESLLQRQFLFVLNLEPRQVMGVESQGMILATRAAGQEEPAVALIVPSRIDVTDGSAAG